MGSGEHGAVFTTMGVGVHMYECRCMYVCIHVCVLSLFLQTAKVKYILPFFSATGLLVLLSTNVLGFFSFMKLEI